MTAKQAELAARYGIVSPYREDLTVPPPELFPDKLAYVVRETGGERILDAMSWGFPHKVPGKRIDKAKGMPREQIRPAAGCQTPQAEPTPTSCGCGSSKPAKAAASYLYSAAAAQLI